MCKKIIIFTIVLSVLSILLSGCSTLQPVKHDLAQNNVVETESDTSSQLSECDSLAKKFENNLHKGIATPEVVVGGTLLSISNPDYSEYTDEYIYKLNFKAATEEVEFKLYSPAEVDVPLETGAFYKFVITDAFGSMTSSGPHNSMFSFDKLEGMFTKVDC